MSIQLTQLFVSAKFTGKCEEARILASNEKGFDCWMMSILKKMNEWWQDIFQQWICWVWHKLLISIKDNGAKDGENNINTLVFCKQNSRSENKSYVWKVEALSKKIADRKKGRRHMEWIAMQHNHNTRKKQDKRNRRNSREQT